MTTCKINILAMAIGVSFICCNVLAREIKPIDVKTNATDGSWFQYRGDRRLSGYSLLKGEITEKPDIIWKYDLSGQKYLLTAGIGKSEKLSLPLKEIKFPYSQEEYELKWIMPEAFYDKDGSGVLSKITLEDSKYARDNSISSQFKVGKFLKDKSGLQMVEWRHGTIEEGSGARLYYRENNKWKELWYSPFDAFDAVNSLVTVGDFNNNGKLEVIGLVWYYLYVLDLETGKILDKVYFHNEGSTTGRGYGWLGAFDCNGDGRQDIVHIADTEAHLNYYSWDENGKLHKIWGKVIESDIAHRKTVLEPATRSVANLMRCENPEVIFSIFNYDYKTRRIGDDTWHICIICPLTGELLYDFSDHKLVGLFDINNDGVDEIFTTEAKTIFPSPNATLRIYQWDSKSQDYSVIWQKDSGSFVTHNFWEYPLNVANSAPRNNETILITPLIKGGNPVFFTSKISDSENNINHITAWQINNGNIEKVGLIEGPGVEIIRNRVSAPHGKSILIRSATSGNETTIKTEGFELSVLSSEKSNPPLGSATVYKDKNNGDLYIFATAANDRVIALKKARNASIKKLWSATGRGTGKDRGDNSSSVVLGNIIDNNQIAVLYSAPDPSGFSQLKAVNLEGYELWTTPLIGLPWNEPPSVTGVGAIYWQTGYFTASSHQDVVLQIKASAAHSDFKTWMISGVDGSVLWKREEGAISNVFRKTWPAGGYWYTVLDWNGDGNEDLFNTWFGQFFAISGSSGRYVFNYDPAYYFNRWTPYGMGWTGSFLGNGKIQTVYSHPSQGHLLLWERNWVTGWSATDMLKFDLKFHHQYQGRVGSLMPAIGDFNGDGNNELVFSAAKGISCFDIKDGNLQWYLSSISGELVSCDITSDGIDEILISSGNQVICVKYNRETLLAEVLWDYSFPEPIGALALTGYDKNIQIIVICEDGYIYSLGRKKQKEFNEILMRH